MPKHKKKIVLRNKTKGKIQLLNEELEERVKERTSALQAANEQLQKEIDYRRKAEIKISEQAALLKAINRVFQEAFTCETEEQLGKVCLSVAEELTDSKFGFFGEINESGLFDINAISNPGRDVCKMAVLDARNHIVSMPIRGVDRATMRDGISRIVNGPKAIKKHPDHVKIPEGHPLITAFLGVPLKHTGKTIGMIGLGNKEGGYTLTDQENVEALSAAMVQAMRNKRSEEIRNLNTELEHRAAELETSNRELEAFSYSVSHDLRSPLRSIDGFSQVLLEDYSGSLDEGGKDALNRVRRATQRMGQLIDDMIKLSRVARTDIKHERVDLSSLAKAIVTELQKTQPERRVEFIVQQGVSVNGDLNMLWVFMENLLDNSWKFTIKNPEAKIEFGVKQINGKPVYFVQDNGVGFDLAYSDKLFAPFQRLHSEAEYPGTGIGLATAKRIISRLRGSIWAEGATDKGAIFYFTI